MKYTDIRLQTLQDEDMIILLENNFRGDKSSVIGDRYVKTSETVKMLHNDADKLYGHSMSQPYHTTKLKLLELLY